MGGVGAAGTGIQVVTSLLDLAGSGITAAIGTGSNDVKETIGGITLKTGIGMLSSHSKTKVITVISKPPSEKIVNETVELLSEIKKPGVMNFIGYKGKDISDNLKFADTLEDAARISYSFVKNDQFKLPEWTSEDEVNQAKDRLTEKQVYIRGLFSGGTICYETQYLMSKEGIKTYSNAPLDKDYEIGGFDASKKDTVLDMGSEEFVRGVPHPMIDFRFRKERLLKEVEDKEVAVILFDVVLGYGANMNPAAEMVEVIKKARSINERVSFVASVIGTERDPQGLSSQVEQLKSAGVLVYPSSTRATQVALKIAKR